MKDLSCLGILRLKIHFNEDKMCFQVTESYVLERDNLDKRGYRDPDDPR